MTGLTPLIELATQKSLDLFFRAGQGYLAQSVRGFAERHAVSSLTPLGVQSRAQARIVCVLGPSPAAAQQPYARPGGAARRQPVSSMR